MTTDPGLRCGSAALTSIVDHDVQAAETLHGASDKVLTEFLVSQIAGD